MVIVVSGLHCYDNHSSDISIDQEREKRQNSSKDDKLDILLTFRLGAGIARQSKQGEVDGKSAPC